MFPIRRLLDAALAMGVSAAFAADVNGAKTSGT